MLGLDELVRMLMTHLIDVVLVLLPSGLGLIIHDFSVSHFCHWVEDFCCLTVLHGVVSLRIATNHDLHLGLKGRAVIRRVVLGLGDCHTELSHSWSRS